MKAAKLTLVSIALLATILAFAGSSVAGKAKKVYWIDLAGQASEHPERVYFTANAGGYLEDIKWKGWGEKKAVGRGTFGTTAPCNGRCPGGPSKLELRKPVECTPEFGEKKGKRVRVYRHAKLTYPDEDGEKVSADVTDRGGWSTCKQSG